MTALAGAVAGLRMLADGSVSVTIIFEPKDRNEVMKYLGSPGQPVACAALVVGFAAKSDAKTGTVGPRAREAVALCADEQFQYFIAQPANGAWGRDQDSAKAYILAACTITSRKELDTNEAAWEKFRDNVRGRFLHWARTRQQA